MPTISRDQFDGSKFVVRKKFHKGTYIMDADLNEAFKVIDVQLLRRLMSGISQNDSMRFDTGFKIVQSGTPDLYVTAQLGTALFKTAADYGNILLHHPENSVIGAFTTWTGARTDYVYIQITEAEWDADDDPDIVNPEHGEITCHDIRITYEILISEGSSPTPVGGTTQIVLATITKTSGSTIIDSDITDLITQFEESLLPVADSITTAMLQSDCVDGTKIADDAIGNEHMQDNSVDSNEIVALAVTEAKIGAAAVTNAKLNLSGLDVGGGKITDVGTPTLAGDAATKDYVDTAPTLDTVTDTDATTPNSIEIGYALTLNKDFGAGDASIVFRKSGSGSASLRYFPVSHFFEFNDEVRIVGLAQITGDLDLNGAIDVSGHAYNHGRVRDEEVTQVITGASDTIGNTAALLLLSSGSPYTMSSTPTIAWEAACGGCRIILINTGANAITLQDESNLSGSKLRLAGGNNIVLGVWDTLTLLGTTAGNDYWVELARSNNYV
jgi:hypothetical protein